MIGFNGKQATIYHGDYKPAELYGPEELPAILWNQQIAYHHYPTGYSTGISPKQDGNATVYTLTAEFGSGAFFEYRSIVAGHKYYVKYHAKPGKENQSPIRIRYLFALGDSYSIVIPLTAIEREQDVEAIITARYNTENRDHINIFGSIGDSVAFSDLQLFDMTAMFGEGNELDTVDEFKSLFPESYYPYDSGTWKRLPDGAKSSYEATFTDRFAGWKEIESAGKEIIVEDTYDDRLDLVLHGKHSQYQQDEVSALYAGDYFSFWSGEQSYLKSAVVAGRHEQMNGYAVKLNQQIGPFVFARRTDTLNGVTIVPSEDGTSYTLSGTATSLARFLIVVSNAVGYEIKGHKCFMRGCPPGGGLNTYHMDGYGCDYDFGEGYYGRCSFDYRVITIEKDATVENLVFKPEIIDLTEMFGTGNEPTSIEAMKAMFPEDFYPQNLGGFRLAPEGYATAYCTPSVYLPQEIMPAKREILCVHGKNLASEEGWSAVNTRTPIALENHRFTISYTGARDVAYQKVFTVKAGCQYTFSLYAEFADNNEDNPPVIITSPLKESWYTMNGENRFVRRSGGKNGRYAVTFIPSSDTIRVAISLTSYTNGISGTSSFWNMQLEEGIVATDYEPYETPQKIEHELPIYGDNDCKDTFDFITGAEIQRWDRIVFTGSESWYQYGCVVALAVDYPAKIHHWKDNVGEQCNIARYSEEGNTAVIPGFFTTYRPAADVKGWIIFHEEIDVAEWKAYLSWQYEAGTPVYVVYPLEEPRCRKQAVDAVPLLPNTVVVVESNPGLQQSEVVVEPQMPSPQFHSEVDYLESCTVWSSGKNLFNPYGEINYGLYSYHGSTYVGNNGVDENGNILVRNGSNGYLYGQQWKGLPAGVYTASFDVVDKGDAKGGIYAGITKNGKFASYTSSGGMGHHVYHVEVTENDWFCLFFGFSGATMKVTEKPIVFANVQLERGTEATTYMPYFTPFQQDLPFELFGNGEVNDTCEPCVLVDGEWKCRVTRRWWKVDLEKYRDILVGIYKKKDDVTCFTISQLGLYTSEPAKTAGWQTSICSHFKNINGSYDRFIPGLYSDQPSLTGMYFTVEGINTVEAFRQWYIENEVVTMYQTAKPVVELYDPLPLRTIPRYTHISNDAGAEMNAKLKAADV